MYSTSFVAVPFLVFKCITDNTNSSYSFSCFAPLTLLLSALDGFFPSYSIP